MSDSTDEREVPRAGDAPTPDTDDDSRANVWQWLAIAVLLACWLAEASLGAGPGP